MWILPKQLHTSVFVPDTEALSLDSNESSQLCAQSLFVRSKPSPARTWLLKWKRDSWAALLFGRILKPSHGQTFTERWTSSLEVTPASPSPQQVSEQERKTQDTSGHLFQPELLQCDQVPVSLKTSRDISRWGCPTSSKTWQDWVTERRGAYSARLKSAHRTSGSGSSSWPTVTAFDFNNTPLNRIDGTGRTYKSNLKEAVHQNWPTAASRDWKGCYTTLQRKDGKMRGDLLPDAVNIEEMYGHPVPASWPTPQAQDTQRTPEAYAAAKAKRGGNMFLSLNIAAQLHGHPVPESSSTGGSRPAQHWGTPTARDNKSGRGNNDRDYKELTPMPPSAAKLNPRWVETLMGLPVGWTMPSCACPVTIAPTSCAFSATESSQQQQSEHSDY